MVSDYYLRQTLPPFFKASLFWNQLNKMSVVFLEYSVKSLCDFIKDMAPLYRRTVASSDRKTKVYIEIVGCPRNQVRSFDKTSIVFLCSFLRPTLLFSICHSFDSILMCNCVISAIHTFIVD